MVETLETKKRLGGLKMNGDFYEFMGSILGLIFGGVVGAFLISLIL